MFFIIIVDTYHTNNLLFLFTIFVCVLIATLGISFLFIWFAYYSENSFLKKAVFYSVPTISISFLLFSFFSLKDELEFREVVDVVVTDWNHIHSSDWVIDEYVGDKAKLSKIID